MSRSYYATLDVDSLPPAPTAAEERAMFTAFRARRTAERREAIVRCYLRFALHAARRDLKRRPAHFRTRVGMSEDDAISAANLGLVEAVERFDPSMGFRFTTYATFWIFKRLLEARYGAHLVGISYTDKRLFGKLSRLVNREGMSLDCAAKALGLTASEAQRLLDLPQGRTEALRLTAGQEANDSSSFGKLRDSVSPDAEPLVDEQTAADQMEREEQGKRVLEGLDALPPLTRRVVRELHVEGRTVAEVARRTRLTEQAVEAMSRGGLEALRRRLEE